jgi:hypothetical protein
MAATAKRTDSKLNQFPFVTTKLMIATSGLSADRLKHLRRTVLKEKIYWFHPPGSIRILWNAALVKDWLVNGNSPTHQLAIESYLKSLPSSQSA